MHNDYKIGDLIEVLPEYHMRAVHTSLEMFAKSSNCGNETIKKGDIGIIVITPTIWGRKQIIFGILFKNKIKYVSFHCIRLIKKTTIH